MAKKEYEFHDVANIFPMMNDIELESLTNDIKANGLREPIYLHVGKIIDGRNRYKACLAAKVKPIFREYTGLESGLIDFVISLNIHRRHLTTSQKACLAVDVLPNLETNIKENLSKKLSAIRKKDSELLTKLSKPENSRATASKAFAVSEGSISSAKLIKDKSIELFERVKSGELTLNQAKKLLTENQAAATMERAVLQIVEPPETMPEITLTKADFKRVAALVSYGMTDIKARQYISDNKRNARKSTAIKRAQRPGA